MHNWVRHCHFNIIGANTRDCSLIDIRSAADSLFLRPFPSADPAVHPVSSSIPHLALADSHFALSPHRHCSIINKASTTRPHSRYCDGAFQMGEREAPRQIAGKGTIYIRGHRIKTALMNEFLTNTTIGLSAATDIVVGGCSAGAVSTWLFADSWAAAVPSAKTVALPDSGFFIRFDPSPTKNFTENLLELVAYQNGTIALPQACLTGHPTPSLCIFPQVSCSLARSSQLSGARATCQC